MLHKAKEIIRIMKELDDKFGTMDDGFKALMLEKELEKLLETPRILGCWVREIDSCTINIGHADYIVTPERTAGNSININMARMRTLTMEEFEKMPPETIFSKGECIDGPTGANMTNSGKQLRWIAKKGSGNDWSIYVHWATTVWSYILSNGDTVSDKSNITNLIKCDEDVLKLYNR